MPQVETVRVAGKRLRELRTQRGLSARRLGALINRHEKSVSRLEFNPDAVASRVFIHQLARALQVDVNELIRPDEDAGDEPNGARAA